MLSDRQPRVVSPGQVRIARLLAGAAFLLLLAGGLVTTYRVGMAVPDWPTTFGYSMFAYPLDEMLANFGVTIEHGHRMLATLVGVLSIVTLLIGLRGSPRAIGLGILAALLVEFAGWGTLIASASSQQVVGGIAVPALVLLAVAGVLFVALVSQARVPAFLRAAVAVHLLVVGQGLLGGSRVLENARQLAFLHGALAQLVWASIAALLVVSSVAWLRSASRDEVGEVSSPVGLRVLALVTFVLVYAQIVVGAWLRHSGRMDAFGLHGLGALAATAAMLLLAHRLGRAAATQTAQRRSVLLGLRRWILLLLGLQIALGLFSTVAIFVWSGGFEGRVAMAEAVSATLHVAVGAALLGVSLAACLWTARLFKDTRAEADLGLALPDMGRTA
jgi:cytochrome c oxidase assembly protein subunit 15